MPLLHAWQHVPATRMTACPCCTHDFMLLLYAWHDVPALRMITCPYSTHDNMSLQYALQDVPATCPCYTHDNMSLLHAWQHFPATRMTTCPCFEYMHGKMSHPLSMKIAFLARPCWLRGGGNFVMSIIKVEVTDAGKFLLPGSWKIYVHFCLHNVGVYKERGAVVTCTLYTYSNL